MIAWYSAWVRDGKGDTKKLYKMGNTLMGPTLSNPLPNHTNDKLLADEFTDFLWIKFRKSETTSLKIQYTNWWEKAYQV